MCAFLKFFNFICNLKTKNLYLKGKEVLFSMVLANAFTCNLLKPFLKIYKMTLLTKTNSESF